MRCLRFVYPLGCLALSGALVVLGPSNGRAAGPAEYGPYASHDASDAEPGRGGYDSGYWYDGYYGNPNDAYGFERYNAEYPYGGYYEAYDQHESETADVAADAVESADALNTEEPIENQPESGIADEYGYDRYGYDEYSYYRYEYDDYDYDYGYDDYHAYDYEADYWQDDVVARDAENTHEVADQAGDATEDQPASEESGTVAASPNAYDYTDDYGYYGYDGYGYEYDGYGYYDEYGAYGEYGRTTERSTPAEAATETADDDLSKTDVYEEADVVDRYGYWDGYGGTFEEELPLPPGPKGTADLDDEPAGAADAQSDETIPAEADPRHEGGYDYDGYYYDGYEYGAYDYDEYIYERYNYSEQYGKYNSDYSTEDASGREDQDAREHTDAEEYAPYEYDYDSYDEYNYGGYNYDGYDGEYDYDYGDYQYQYDAGVPSETKDAPETRYDAEYDAYDYNYDYDYCEYGYDYPYDDGDATDAEEMTYDTAASTGPGRYMDDLDPFTWLPRDLLQSADKELLRTLNALFEEPGIVREGVLNEYIESLGLDAVEFVARFEEAFGHQSLMLEDDLPGIAALLSTYRMVELGELGMNEGVETLRQHFNHLSPEWIEDVSLIVTELPPRSVRAEPQHQNDAEVLHALLAAAAHSIGSVGQGLANSLGELTAVPARFTAFADGSGWSGLGTATVRGWTAR